MDNLKDHKKHYLSNYYGRNKIINWQKSSHMERSIEVAELRKEDTVLDLGCADCELIIRIQDKCGRIIGVDRNIKHVEVGRQRLVQAKANNTQLMVMNATTNLTFPDEYFDKIFCLETFEHATHKEELLSEMYRTLKGDGVLIITSPMETGIPLLIKYLVASLFKRFSYRAKYTPRELFDAVFLHKVAGNDKIRATHKNFSWKRFKEMVEKQFIIEVFEGIPVRAFGTFLNSGILLTCKKRT